MPYIPRPYYQSLSPEKKHALGLSNIFLGQHPETQDELLVPDSDRYAGTYMLGVQGTGKTALLENMIAYDNKVGNAVTVIDAHGDLTKHIIAQLPPHRVEKTYLLDMEDESYPFGVNVFAVGHTMNSSVSHTQAIERIMHVFEVLWSDVLTQQHLPRYVRAATITLLSNPGATLVDMHTFLIDEQFRARLLKNVQDPSVVQFWHAQYDNLSESEQHRRVMPLIGRLEALFMGRSLVRNIVGQRRPTISFRKAIENREMIIVKLPVKTLYQDARLVGSIVLSQIQAAVFSFADMPEKSRPGVSLYVDEFQHFATSDFSELFTEGRKFGVRVTVAHQYRSQLPPYLKASTMTARTKVCFQTTPEDGREMAHLFPSQETVILPEDMNAHPVEYLVTYGVDDPVVHTFIATYLRPLMSQRRGQRVEIHDTGFSLTDTAFGMLNGGRGDNPRVADPTPYLDNLLYQVMRTGDIELPIAPEIVMGFSNCGRGFFQAARAHAGRGSDLLLSGAGFPAHLAVQTDDGLRWSRKPESGMEQLYHFLFHLRMTMLHLADNPIGKASSPSNTDVGQMLVNLPRRAAFVRTAETVGVIYTNDTLKPVNQDEFMQRLGIIQARTRLKYCHPREDVESGLVAREPSVKNQPSVPHTNKQAGAPVSRWEEA